jgi:hypothetical protein
MARLLAALAMVLSFGTHAQNPVQDVQQAAPHLVAFSGSPINFQSLVQGLALGRPVQLTTSYANGMAEVATFAPAGPMPVASIVNALDQARLQLAGLGLAQPNATQLATALVGGTLARPNVQLGGLISTPPAPPCRRRSWPWPCPRHPPAARSRWPRCSSRRSRCRPRRQRASRRR